MSESIESPAQPWETNPLVMNIRPWAEKHARACFLDSLRKNAPVSRFDIILQTMLTSCSYEPHEIWRGDDELVEGIASKVQTGQTDEVAGARWQMETAITDKVLKPNTVLLFDILNSQTKRLQQLAARNHGWEQSPGVRLPPEHSIEVRALRTGNKLGWALRTTDIDRDGFHTAVANTGQANEYIIYQPVDRQVSRALAEGSHYVHSARDDEIAAFGAFLPYADFPFAWVSYSEPGRQYKRSMLEHSGADPNESLELTRAWEAEGAPRNTLSMLYAYAHQFLRASWRRKYGRELEAVITAVDPNLGFVGSAFRAVEFEWIGSKATKYAFSEDSSGTRHYVTRRGAEAGYISGNAPQLIPSQFPLLDTHELVLRFKRRGQRTSDQPRLRHAAAEYAMAG